MQTDSIPVILSHCGASQLLQESSVDPCGHRLLLDAERTLPKSSDWAHNATQSLYYCVRYTFVNLDFNTSMASTTILLKNSFSVSKSQCHNTVRRERSTNAWRVTLEGSSSFRNIVYTLCRRFNCVTCGLLRKRDKVTCFEQVFYILQWLLITK